jgi:hypothetical protein
MMWHLRDSEATDGGASAAGGAAPRDPKIEERAADPAFWAVAMHEAWSGSAAIVLQPWAAEEAVVREDYVLVGESGIALRVSGIPPVLAPRYPEVLRRDGGTHTELGPQWSPKRLEQMLPNGAHVPSGGQLPPRHAGHHLAACSQPQVLKDPSGSIVLQMTASRRSATSNFASNRLASTMQAPLKSAVIAFNRTGWRW